MDKKGQTALHIAAKGTNVEVVEELINADRSSINIADTKGNTALHIADRKGRSHIVKLLLDNNITDTKATRRRVQGIAKQLNKMHTEGLNNAINSTTVVAVLIATVAFAAIFTVPGQYVEDTSNLPDGHSLGEANIASTTPFIIFFIFDFIALFISLAVVVVQTSVVVIESKAKKQMMAVINRLACVLMRSHLRFEEDLNLFKMVLMLKIITSPYMLNEFDVSSYPKVGSNTFYPDFSHRFEEQEGCVLVTESSSVDSTSNVKAPVKREGSPIERIEPAFYQSSANNHGPSVTIKKAKTEKSG
ncbi:BnaCnng35650D [Brassica napus]|uniref:BnaCnng35650D protein n=1 Tax=Brassica napus TaxID=3708 RepID=A0A078J8V1_BRANA|nr:BnaCnng35650D [Brassica napus]